MLQRSILVCDADPAFLESLKANPLPYVSFLCARSMIEAQHQVANRQNRLASIAINPSLADPGAIPLIRFCREHRPATPISLISDDPAFPPPKLDLAELQIQKVLHKPIEAQELAAKLIPVTVFEMDKAIELARHDTTVTGGTTDEDDAEMHAIEAETFSAAPFRSSIFS